MPLVLVVVRNDYEHEMQRDLPTPSQNRPLTDEERGLARWMLEHGTPEARRYLDQLERAEVTPVRCPCGCASLDFQVRGSPHAPPGINILADFVYGPDEDLKGIFIYEKDGILSGIEVSAYTGDVPRSLPLPEQLRPSGWKPSD